MDFFLCKEILIFLVILTVFDWFTHYISHTRPEWDLNHSHSIEHHTLDSTPNYTYHHIPFFQYLYNWTTKDSAVTLNILITILLILLAKPRLILVYVFLLHFCFISTIHYLYHLKPEWKISKHHQKHHHNNNDCNFSLSPFGFFLDDLFGTRQI